MSQPVRPALLCLSIGLMACDPIVGQPTFFKMYNRGNSGFAVREVPGGYAVAGGTDHYANWHWLQLSSPATTDIHLFKTDLNGTLQWERVIGNPASRTIARWMEPTTDGGYIIAGSDGRDKFWPPDSNDVVLVKTDALGNVTWSRVFDTGKDEVAHAVQQTSDGGYIVSGFHDSAPMSALGTTFILLIKTDPLGSTQWAKRIPFANRDFITGEPFTYVVKQTADHGFVIVGTSVGALALGVYLVRTDAAGAVLWAKVYEHDATALRYSTGLDILEHTNGDLLIAGSMDKSQPMETNFPYVLRISSTGALLSAKFFETVPPLFFQSGFSSVRPTASGGFFFCGMGGYGGFGDQAQMLKTDAGLNTIWSRVYTWDGGATMGARSGRPTSDGGHIFTGKRQFAGTVLMKTDAAGMIPCKTPNTLSPLLPSLIVQDRFPVPEALTIGGPILFSTTTPLVDSTTVCPITVVTLPVQLASFSAEVLEDERVLTSWTTLSEQDNSHFLVERSADGEHFAAVARIEGAGHSTTGIHYEWTDDDPIQAPVSYYRLIQVDLDGRQTASAMATAVFAQHDLDLIGAHITDGPSLLLRLSSAVAGPVRLTLNDLSGRTLAIRDIHVERGANTFTLPLGVPLSGYHLLTLTDTRTSIAIRLFL